MLTAGCSALGSNGTSDGCRGSLVWLPRALSSSVKDDSVRVAHVICRAGTCRYTRWAALGVSTSGHHRAYALTTNRKGPISRGQHAWLEVDEVVRSLWGRGVGKSGVRFGARFSACVLGDCTHVFPRASPVHRSCVSPFISPFIFPASPLRFPCVSHASPTHLSRLPRAASDGLSDFRRLSVHSSKTTIRETSAHTEKENGAVEEWR